MGGVDLADQRRLHANSTVMGQHRWWLKLFFYLLDVGTANALVLFRLTLKDTDLNKWNIALYKQKLILSLVGSRGELVQRPLPP
jgi:hypothetical protein